MNKKPLIISFLSICVISVCFSYSLVFAGAEKITKAFILSNNIFVDSTSLNKTSILFSTSTDLSKQKITADCNFYSKLPQKIKGYYLYDLKFFDDSCRGKIFQISSENQENKNYFSLNFYTQYSLLNNFSNKSDKTLETMVALLHKETKKESNGWYHKKIKTLRKSQEAYSTQKTLENILEKRGQKYQVPVVEWKISNTLSKIPNAGRPYRQSYTDGVHHGWDVSGKFWEKIIAIDDGVIVRTTRDFEKADMKKIVYGKNLSYEQKLWNLDILRGKQVWLKTMKWDLVFYSHLDNIFENIKEGSVVRKWQPIGTIGITGIPATGYNDYHLHFPIHKNPYNEDKAGYTTEEYMSWPWYFKWKNAKYIQENQSKVFE